MALLDRKVCYSIGMSQCDREHRGLVAGINQLYEAIRFHPTRQHLPEIVAALEKYTETHSRHEERLTTDQEFPGLKEHQRE